MRFIGFVFCAAFALLGMTGFAATPYEFDDAFVRATPAKISAAYVVIKNPTAQQDVLVKVSADWAEKTELHDVRKNAENILEMIPVEKIILPAGGKLSLRPGGRHLMLFGLKDSLKENQTVKLTLHFKQAGAITVPFTVRPLTYMGIANK